MAPSEATNREAEWSRDRLVSLLRERLSGIRVVVVANREPYIHNRVGRSAVSSPDPSGQRPGHRARTDHARHRRHVDRARQRQRRPRDRRTRRPRARAARTSRVHAAARLAHAQEEEEGYYYGFANEGALAALPHRAHAPRVSTRATGSSIARQPSVRRRRARGDRRRPTRSCSCRTITSRCCRGSSSSARPDATVASSGTSRGRTPRRSASARGRKRSSTACSAAICSASTRSCTATISSRPSIARSSRASTASTSRVARAAHDTACGRSRSASTWPAHSQHTASGRSDVRARSATSSGFGRVRARHRRRSHGLHEGHPRALPRLERFLERYPEWRGHFVFVQIGAPSRTRDPAVSRSQRRSRRAR